MWTLWGDEIALMDENGWPIEVYVERSDGRIVIVEIGDRHAGPI
jgi:hypothetical protein